MTRRPPRLRPSRADVLGLRRALSDRLLPMLVGAMAFMALLGLAGVIAAAALAQHWQRGAGATLVVQVPDGDVGGRLDRVLAVLRATPDVRDARALEPDELEALLRPWLGSGPGRVALPLPAVVSVRVDADPPGLATRLEAAAPGTLLEADDGWVRRLAALARSVQACAALAMGVVGFVAVAVVTVATRAGLATRREAIEIVHGLGATDGFIAGRFARRIAGLASAGGLVGTALALPVLLWLTALAAPFAGGPEPDGPAGLVAALPALLWAGLPAMPLAAGALGWLTAQLTVRRWLRRLP